MLSHDSVSASLQLSSFSHGDPVSGANRYKYFRRYLLDVIFGNLALY